MRRAQSRKAGRARQKMASVAGFALLAGRLGY
jgi:hypothetical protein